MHCRINNLLNYVFVSVLVTLICEVILVPDIVICFVTVLLLKQQKEYETDILSFAKTYIEVQGS